MKYFLYSALFCIMCVLAFENAMAAPDPALVEDVCNDLALMGKATVMAVQLGDTELEFYQVLNGMVEHSTDGVHPARYKAYLHIISGIYDTYEAQPDLFEPDTAPEEWYNGFYPACIKRQSF